jgi:hypothetical protein
MLGDALSHVVDDVNGNEPIRHITASMATFRVLVGDGHHTPLKGSLTRRDGSGQVIGYSVAEP